jgi:fatty acid desaturase 3 (delta-6 desaturase)
VTAAAGAEPRTISFEQARDEGFVIVGDDVYDISKFSAKHPGGPEISQLRGGDATFPLINAHGILGELPTRLPKKLIVGKLDRETLSPVDRDLRELWAQLRERGMFHYKLWWFLLDIFRGLGIFVLGWLMLDRSPVIAFFALLVARLNVMWWVHDVCHDSVFEDRAVAKRWAEMMSILFVGTSVHDYQYVVHRMHHGFTNTIGADQAIETGPVVWHQLMRARTSDTFVPIQSWFWFLVVLPLTLPYFVVIGAKHSIRDREWLALLGVIARWAICIWLFWDHLLVFLVPSFLSAYILGLTASLNHFHMPMAEQMDWNFARSVATVTQNLGAQSRVSSWLVGGLSFHIEHHFFATMPRRNYRKIAPEIRAFCARNGLPYRMIPLSAAVGNLWNKLRRPYDDNAPPSRPSMEAHRAKWR